MRTGPWKCHWPNPSGHNLASGNKRLPEIGEPFCLEGILSLFEAHKDQVAFAVVIRLQEDLLRERLIGLVK